MSDTGCNYRNLLDCNSELNVNQSIVKWKMKQAKLHKMVHNSVLDSLIMKFLHSL